MARTLDIPIALKPFVDQAQLKKVEAILDKATNVEANVTISDAEITELVSFIEDTVDKAFANVDATIDMSAIQDDLKNVATQIEELADHDITPYIDFGDTVEELNKVQAEYDGIIANFETIKKQTTEAYERQKKYVAALQLAGDVDSPDFKAATEQLKELKKQVDDVTDAETKLAELLQEPPTGVQATINDFEKLKKETSEAYEQQKKLVTALQLSGKVDTPEYEDSVKQLKALKAEVDTVVEAEQKLAELFNEPPTGIDALIQDFEKVKKETADAYDKQKKYVAALQLAGKTDTPEYKEAAKQAGELKDKLEEIAKIEGEAGSDPMGFVAQVTALNEIADGLGSVVERGEAYNDSLKKLKAQTGATGEELGKLESQARNLFAEGVGESAAEALQIVAQSRQTLGKVFGENIEGITTDIAKLSKAYDKEFGEIASAGATFAKSFKLSQKDTTELLALGLRDAKTGADDFLGTIAEFSPILAQAGLTANQVVGIFSRAGEEAAANTGKFADAIKETGIRLKEGDIDNTLKTISLEMGERIPDALSKTLLETTNLAKTGQISVAELLQKSTAEIEKSFELGNIDEVMRAKLQSAVAGAPAEEVGAELFARVFANPVDEKAVRQKALAAANSVRDAMQNSSIFEGLSKQLEAVQDKAAAVALPLVKGFSEAASLAPKLAAIKQALPESAAKALDERFTSIAKTAGTQLKGALSGLKGSLGGLSGIMSPQVLGIAAAAAALTYFFTQTEKGKAIVEKVQQKLTELWEKAKPALTALGNLLETIFGGVIELAIGNFELFFGIVTNVIEKVVEGFTWIGEKLGIVSQDAVGAGDAFATIETIINNVTAAFEGAVASVNSIKESIGGAVDSLFDLDFGGFIDAVSGAGEKAGKAAKEAVEKNLLEVKIEKLQDKLSEGLTIQEDIDKNNKIGELVENFKKAKDDIAKENIAKQIAEQVPGAVNGMKSVVDLATGEVKEVYDINLDAAQKYVNDQKTILNGQVASSKTAFVELFREQSKQLDETRAKAQQLADQISNPKAGQDVEKLREEYSKTKAELEKNADMLKKVAEQGQGLDIAGKELENIAKEAGRSDDEAKKLAGTFNTIVDNVKKAKLEVNALAADFNNAVTNSQNIVTQNTAALSKIAVEAQTTRDKLSNTKDLEERKKLEDDLKELKGKETELLASTNKTYKEGVDLSEKQLRAQRMSGQLDKTKLDKAQELIAVGQANVAIDQRAFAIKQELDLLDQKRQRTAIDDYAAAKQAEAAQRENLRIMMDQYGIAKGNVAEQEKILALISEQISKTGKVDEKSIKESIAKIRTTEQQSIDEAKKQIKAELIDAIVSLEETKLARLQLQAQLNVDMTALDQAEYELLRRKYEIDVELGVRDERDIVKLVEGRLNKTLELQKKNNAALLTEEQKLQQKQNALLAETDEAKKVQLDIEITAGKQRVTELKQKNIEYENEVIDHQQDVIALNQTFYDKQLAKLDEQSAKELEKLAEINDKKLEKITFYADMEAELRVALAEEANNDVLKVMDEFFAEQLKQFEEQNADELALLAESQSIMGRSERENAKEQLRLKEDLEAKKKVVEEAAQKAREEQERKHQNELLKIQSQAEGQKKLAELQKTRSELHKEQETLKAKIEVAQSVYNANQTVDNKKSLDDLKTQLTTMQTTLTTQGDAIYQAATLAGEKGGEAIGNMFAGNSEAVADNFRELFGTISGALKEMASAFVVQYVLSPSVTTWLTGTFGPFGAPIGIPIITALVRGLVNEITAPIFDGLLSFSTGGMVDKPTLAVIGDGARLGGANREWILRNDQMQSLLAESANMFASVIDERLGRLEDIMLGSQLVAKVSGNDLYLMINRSAQTRQSRLIGS